MPVDAATSKRRQSAGFERVSTSGHRLASDAHFPHVMRTLHKIRLRGPWGCQPLARFDVDAADEVHETTEGIPPAGRLVMPSDWAPVCGADFRGRVRFRRRFHWPTRLMPRERVWLVFDGVCGAAVVRLNERLLGHFTTADAPAEFDVTEPLEPTNVLLVDVVSGPARSAGQSEQDPATGGLTGEVRLEVRAAARNG